MRKTFSLLLALALVLSLSLVAAVPAMAATTYYVATTGNDGNTGGSGDPWLTIQHAVDTVSGGDTINVAAGTYNEAVSIPSGKDGLEIAGTNAIVDGTTLGNANGFNIASNNVKIHGFTIQNFVSIVNMQGWGIITAIGTSGGELYGNTITSGSGGIYICASTNYEVYDNNINNLTGDWPLHGHGIIVYSQDNVTAGPISGNIIGKLGHPNTISDTHTAPGGHPGSGQGIFVGSDNVLAKLVNADGTKVEYNIVSNVYDTKAIQVAGVTTTSTVDVRYNQISGSKLWGLHIQYCGTVNVNSNTFSGTTINHVVASYDVANPGNCLTGEEMYDIFKHNGNTFDKAAAAVTPAGNAINTSLAVSSCRYIQSDIQDAINDAHTGYSVEVLAGTYDEIVVVDKANLTVQAGSKPLIQPTGAAGWPTIGAVNIMANGVTFDGFEVDASLMTGNRAGINAYGVSDVTIRNNEVHGVTGGSWHGMGIVAWDWDGTKTVDRATIENNEVYDTGRMGIFCMDYGSGVYDLTEDHIIRGNTVYDTWLKGDAWGDAGGAIQINVGKDCIIEDNEIFNTASSWYASHYNAGIYISGSGTGNVIKCNTIRDNPAGVTLWVAGPGTYNFEGDTATSPEVHYNNIYNNTNYGAYFVDTTLPMHAENNWWGDNNGSGPHDPQDETIGGVWEDTEAPPCSGSRHMMNTDGTGDVVRGRVLYCPWLSNNATTTTGAGTASFTCSHGCLANVIAVSPTPPNQPVDLPYGVFSFNISCINPGQQVTVTVTLPGPVPAGSVWWKYQGGSWYWLPIGDDDGDNIITVTLTDGGQGDADLTANGEIIDDGGPGAGIIPFYRLDIFSTEGGSVTDPGEGMFVYYFAAGKVVNLVASPDDGYKFMEWIGDIDTIADVDDGSTTITIGNTIQWEVLKWYCITAKFEAEGTSATETSVQYVLTVSSTMGGSVTSPGEGASAYEAGTVVNLVASPDDGYEFVDWTGDSITNVDSATTSVTMNGDYTVKATFEFEETTTTDSTEGPSGLMGCFIATAAYGTPTAEQIDVLREFRDVVLLENSVGSEFVALYYQLSPLVADFIAGNSFLKTVVRELLVDPVVWIVEATGNIWRN